jgi:UDPglucose--hexose-1-phosphate uridylyltransferase
LSTNELQHLAVALKEPLYNLKNNLSDAAFNLLLHMGTKDNDLHLHFELLPRLSNLAGFELTSGQYINSMPPEEAAKFYRNEVL